MLYVKTFDDLAVKRFPEDLLTLIISPLLKISAGFGVSPVLFCHVGYCRDAGTVYR
jgi:hypothetical protein